MLNHKNSNNIFNKTFLSIVLVFAVANVNAQQLKTAVQVAVDTNQASAAAQVRIDTLSNQTDNLTSEYRNLLNQIESLRAYNNQLENVVNDQREQITAINLEMTTLEQTNRAVVPMIIEMIDSLGQLVKADIPFKLEDRENRIMDLEKMLSNSDVTTAEQYRKVTEAYSIELDYGSSVEAYTGNLPSGKQVDFLRVGRTTLVYQTLNQEVSGWWNPVKNDFETLDRKFNSEIKEAIRIAQKQASPNLAGLPVMGAETAGGQ